MNVLLVLLVQMFFAGALGLSLYLPLMSGQLSLASAAFFGIGGYVAALMSTQVFTPGPGNFPILDILIEMILAGLLCAVIALPLGLVTLRLRGVYFMLATIAFVEAVGIVAQNLDILNGAVGIFGIPQPFNTQSGYLWVAVPLLIIVAIFVYRLERSRIGRALVALREDELAASSMGINPTRYKVLAFVLSAIIAGVTGAVYAHYFNTWNPLQGTFDYSVTILTYVLIGGSETFAGPILGAFVLTLLPEVLKSVGNASGLSVELKDFLQNGRFIIYGILIMVSVLFFPKGLLSPSLWRGFIQRGIKRRREAESAAVKAGAGSSV